MRCRRCRGRGWTWTLAYGYADCWLCGSVRVRHGIYDWAFEGEGGVR